MEINEFEIRHFLAWKFDFLATDTQFPGRFPPIPPENPPLKPLFHLLQRVTWFPFRPNVYEGPPVEMLPYPPWNTNYILGFCHDNIIWYVLILCYIAHAHIASSHRDLKNCAWKKWQYIYEHWNYIKKIKINYLGSCELPVLMLTRAGAKFLKLYQEYSRQHNVQAEWRVRI